jgi:hypothetical protein
VCHPVAPPDLDHDFPSAPVGFAGGVSPGGINDVGRTQLETSAATWKTFAGTLDGLLAPDGTTDLGESSV